MAFKPNYNQQRNDRNRAKEAKKLERLRRREEESERRRTAEGAELEPGEAPGEVAQPGTDVAPGNG